MAAAGDRRAPDVDRLGTTARGRFRISQHDLVGWTAQLCGYDLLDAYQLVSQVGLAPVGNVVDTNYTMLAKFPKRHLGAAEAFDGVHQRLRETAAAYLAQR